MKFNATLKAGTLKLDNPSYFKKQLLRLKEGGYILHLESKKKKRSINQNNYYWGGVLEPIAEYTGYTPEELHAFYKDKFLKKQIMTVGDEKRTLTPSSTKLSTGEFTMYLQKVTAHAAQLGVRIESPEEYYYRS